jgi:hypothetical protein
MTQPFQPWDRVRASDCVVGFSDLTARKRDGYNSRFAFAEKSD